MISPHDARPTIILLPRPIPLEARAGIFAMLVFSQACLEEHPTEFTDAGDETTQGEAPASADDLGEDPYMMALAREIPAFAGIWYDPPGSDRLVIAVTEANTDEPTVAQRAVRNYLMASVRPSAEGPSRPIEFVKRVVDYTFIELAQHRALLRPHVFPVLGVVSLAVDESDNRIAVGVANESAMAAVRDLANRLAIPPRMLSFREEPMIEPLHPREQDSPDPPDCPSDARCHLTGHVPDGMLHGGYEIIDTTSNEKYLKTRDPKGACTLGFTAFRNSDLTEWHFVTASHCSVQLFRTDVKSFIQPAGGVAVGVELWDPEVHDFNDPECQDANNEEHIQTACRKSDATLVRSTLKAPIAPGTIGRTKKRHDERGDYGNLEINWENPFIPITAVKYSVMKGDIVDKVGRTTGWTGGAVVDSCVDVRPGDTNVWRLCSIKVTAMVGEGDSGGPLFRYDGQDDGSDDSSAELVGIVWGMMYDGTVIGDTLYASSMRSIEEELGEMDVLYREWPIVRVVGPNLVVPPAECEWTVDLTGYVNDRSRTPFEYAWSGILTGGGSVLRGSVSATGWLNVTVEDQLGMNGEGSKLVHVYPIMPEHIDLPDDPEPGCYDSPDVL